MEEGLSIFFLYTENSLSWHFENLCYKISLQFCWTTQRIIECTEIMIEIIIAMERLSEFVKFPCNSAGLHKELLNVLES